MKKQYIWLIVAALFFLLPACNNLTTEPDDDGDNPYNPIQLTTKQSGFVEEGNAFSLRLLEKVGKHAIDKGEGNWFVSPLSLQIALGMLLNGAQGETADEICRMLGYGNGETAEVNQWCKLMLEQLPKLDKKTELALANAIFYNKEIELKAPYKDAVGAYYDATLEALDFSKTKASADRINAWSSEKTKGMIPKVLNEVDPQALAYLANALYFKSQWAEKFPKGASGNETFTYEDGGSEKVKMMKLNGKVFNYSENDLFQMVRLPYGNNAYAMTVLLPKKGRSVQELVAFLAKQGRLPYLGEAEVDLWLPRFESKYHIDLNDILTDMGMKTAFVPYKADFLAMSDMPSHVDFVQQDAAIKVDEEGTEAAAVTIIGMKYNSALPMPPEKVVFHADHPFLYLISETSTGAILFAGKYAGK